MKTEFVPYCSHTTTIFGLLVGAALLLATGSAMAEEDRPIAELEVHAGALFPLAEADGLGAGYSVGGAALYRPISPVAVGLVGDFAALPWDAKGYHYHAPNSTLHVGYLGAAARIYPLKHGWAEPFVQLALGLGTLGSSVSGSQCRTMSPHPAAQAALGLDGYLGPLVRASLSVAPTLALFGSSCTEMYQDPDPPGMPLLFTSVAVRAGLTFVLPR